MDIYFNKKISILKYMYVEAAALSEGTTKMLQDPQPPQWISEIRWQWGWGRTTTEHIGNMVY